MAEAANKFWELDILDNSGNPIVSGIPLVYGVDLLAQYAHLDFGGQLIIENDGSAPDRLIPEYETLGVSDNLYFIADE